LCYVAMTRARRQLHLAYTESRVIYGETRRCEPSRFIAEIPMQLLMPVNRPTGAPKPSAKTAAESTPPDALQTGMIVRHASFGKGVVLYTKGSGPKMRIRIRFQTGRTREFLAGHAPLEIVEARRR